MATKRWAVLSIGLTAFFYLLSPLNTLAAPISSSTGRTPSGITVSPAFQQVQIQASETQHQLNFSITNNRPTSETIHIYTQDFNALSDSGGLFFVGTNPTQLQKKYGLAKWLSLPQSSISIAPKQTFILAANILNQPSLAPGGHYGALMLALEGANPNGNVSSNIALHPVVSSLLFVNKVGGDIHKLKLTNVYTSRSPLALPSSVTLRFYNDGNTHLVPRGTVTITSPSGRIVSQGIINEASEIILPQVDRLYRVPLNEVASANAPGHYKLTVAFRFDGYDQFRTYQSTLFLAAPRSLIIFVVLILMTATSVGYYLRKRPKKGRRSTG